MPRPKLDGFNKRQAARFRKEFRRLRKFYGVRADDVGEVLDTHDELHEPQGEGKSSGPKAVSNAMMNGRKLTHRTARRLVAGLFLSEPMRRRKALKQICEDSDILNECEELLYRLGALRSKWEAMIPPVFIPPTSIDALAQRLATRATRAMGIGAKSRVGIERALRECLCDDAAEMERAWEILALKTCASIPKADSIVNVLGRMAFGDQYIYPTQLPWQGHEFQLLADERPELYDGVHGIRMPP